MTFHDLLHVTAPDALNAALQCLCIVGKTHRPDLFLNTAIVCEFNPVRLCVTTNVCTYMGHTRTTNCSCRYTYGNSDDVGSIEATHHSQSMMKPSSPHKWRRWAEGRTTHQSCCHTSATSQCTEKSLSLCMVN